MFNCTEYLSDFIYIAPSTVICSSSCQTSFRVVRFPDTASLKLSRGYRIRCIQHPSFTSILLHTHTYTIANSARPCYRYTVGFLRSRIQISFVSAIHPPSYLKIIFSIKWIQHHINFFFFYKQISHHADWSPGLLRTTWQETNGL